MEGNAWSPVLTPSTTSHGAHPADVIEEMARQLPDRVEVDREWQVPGVPSRSSRSNHHESLLLSPIALVSLRP